MIHRQNDAIECLGVFLDVFEEATENSIQSHWESGKIKRYILDSKTKEIVDTVEESQIAWNIQIPNQASPITLEECITQTYDKHTETIHYKRDGDTVAKDYTIQRKIHFTPTIWIMSLCRWDHMQNKINTPVIIPQKFHIQDKTYILKGVICHSGSSIPSGHYMSIVSKSSEDSTMILIDDDTGRSVPVPFPIPLLRQAYGIVYEIQT